MLDAFEEDARRRLHETVDALSGPGLQVEAHCIRGGAPAEVIRAFAEQHDIHLVMMSSHGRRGVRRLLLGSVTEEVIRRSPCPVLVERREGSATPSSAARRIVVPVDFSEASGQSLEHARLLASALGAEIDLLTVIHDPIYPAPYGAGEMPALVEYLPEIEGRARRRLDDLAAQAAGERVVRAFVRRGDPALQILDHARERECGLIVISTHGASGLNRLLLGSVTEKVLRRAASAVYVVPAAIAFAED
jgi:nucleotide-binding universal stress UspA family protein